MKKIIALVVAILMIASMSVVVFADDKAAESTAGATILTYGVDQAYEVTIPGDQDFAGDDATGYTASGAVSATGVKIAKGETFTVSVSSGNGWTLVDTEGTDGAAISDPVSYDALVDGVSIKTTGTVLTLESITTPGGNSGTKTINFTTAGTGQEGTYVDTLTFVVAID